MRLATHERIEPIPQETAPSSPPRAGGLRAVGACAASAAMAALLTYGFSVGDIQNMRKFAIDTKAAFYDRAQTFCWR